MHITFKEYKFNSMNVKDMMPAAESAAVLMRSLSHPQRLLVLCALVDGEKSVAELRLELGIEQVPMSQQLMRLRSDELVEARREGTTVYYSIARPEVLTVVDALHLAFCAPAGGKRSRGGSAPRRLHERRFDPAE
ncbi:MAG: metalloregulator ArsR/SmtB family transcription factor [Nitrobacter sp.]